MKSLRDPDESIKQAKNDTFRHKFVHPPAPFKGGIISETPPLKGELYPKTPPLKGELYPKTPPLKGELYPKTPPLKGAGGCSHNDDRLIPFFMLDMKLRY